MGLILYSSQVSDIKTNSKGRKIVLSSISRLCKVVPPSRHLLSKNLVCRHRPGIFMKLSGAKGRQNCLVGLGGHLSPSKTILTVA